MPLLGNHEIWYPDEDTPIAPFENLFITQGNSVNKALDAIRSSVPLRVADVADRDKKFPNPRQGDKVYNVAKDRIETYYAGYSAQNPNGSVQPNWYGAGGLQPEVYLPIVGTVELGPNLGVGLVSTQVGTPQFFHGGEDFFSVDNNREVKSKVAGFVEVEFRLSVTGPSSDAGALKANILRNNRNWASTPTPETNMVEDELPSRTSRQWLSGRAARAFFNANDWMQLGVRTINTTSNVRFGNNVSSGNIMPGCFWSIKYVTPRRDT